jgi:NADH:ubiquinone oxidoreductase subunit 6 (subunit J)
MTLWILCRIVITISISVVAAPSPLILGISILNIALLIATIYSTLLSSWLAFLIYLIYVGGILVIFSYFLAITPNQQNIVRPYLIPLLSTFFIILSSTYFLDLWTPITNPSQQTQILYRGINSTILIILILVLLLTIIVVVKISTRTKGPLRAFMSYVQTLPNHSSCNQNH